MIAGSIKYKEGIIPEKAKVCMDKNGVEFYVSGIKNDNGIWSATVIYLHDRSIKNVSYNLIQKYL